MVRQAHHERGYERSSTGAVVISAALALIISLATLVALREAHRAGARMNARRDHERRR
jgi:hypothetical protein